MLKFLRDKKTQKRIYLILAIVIIPPFVFWGVMISNDDTQTSPSTALGRIDNDSVSIKEYLKNYNAVQHQVALMYGEQAKTLSRFINFKGEAWDRLLLLHYAQKEKIKTNDSEVVEFLANQPIFLNHGKFDANFYKAYAANYLRMSTRDFEEEIRQMLMIQKIQQKMRQEIRFGDEELKTLYDSENGERDIVYGILPWESEKNKVQVTEEELATIYPMLKDKFKEPERTKISYIFIPTEDLENLKAALEDKESPIEALSKKYNLTIRETDFFSSTEAIPNIGLSKEILSASFSLPLKAESGWIRTDSGAYKIAVLEKKEGRPLSFEEAKDRLKDLITKQKATEAAVKRLNEIHKKIEAGSLEKALASEGIEAKRAEKFTNESYLQGIGPTRSFGNTISGLKEGEISQAFATPNGAAIAQILKTRAADAEKFEKDKEAFKEKMIEKKVTEKMDSLLNELRNRLTLNLEMMKTLFQSPEEQ